MKFCIEVFRKDGDTMDAYIETDVTPEKVIEVYDDHPVGGAFQLLPEHAAKFGFTDLNFEENDYFLEAVCEFYNETYEYKGVKLYPPPLFLPDCFNAQPVRSKTPE